MQIQGFPTCLILCSLKSGTHGHQEMLSFFAWDAGPFLQLPLAAACVWVSLLWVLYLIPEKLHYWPEIRRRLAIQGYLISLLWQTLGCFYSLLWVIFRLCCEALPDGFCSICLNLSRECSPVHFTVNPAASISDHITNKVSWFPCQAYVSTWYPLDQF